MRKIYIIAIVNLTLFSCQKETSQPQTDLVKENLHGNVKSVMTAHYSAVDMFDEGKIEKYAPNGWGVSYLEFDSIGKKISDKSYLIKEFKKVSDFQRDENGRTVLFRSYWSDGKIQSETRDEYDEYGHRVTEYSTTSKMKKTYKHLYDSQGRLLQTIRSDNEKTYYVYNEKGQLMSSNSINPPFHYKNDYRYDEKGNCIWKKQDYSDDIWYFYSRYDDQNRVIDQITKSVDDGDSDFFEYKNKYYYQGNSQAWYLYKRWDGKGTLLESILTIPFVIEGDTASIITFDEKDNITHFQFITHKSNDTKFNAYYGAESEVLHDYKYAYSDGLLMSVTGKNYITNYEYDGNELVKVIHADDGGKTISEYKNGKITEKNTYNKDGEISFSSSYTYKTKKGVEKEIGTHSIDGEYYSKTIKSRKNGQLIREDFSSTDGRTQSTTYSYNELGDVIEECYLDDKHTYEYCYDSHNNWIRQIEYLNGKAQCYNERRIEYFDE